MLGGIIANILPFMPPKLIWVFSKKYIAGKKVQDAIDITENFESQEICTSIDLLGEHLIDNSKIQKYKQIYVDLINQVKNRFNITYSLKPTMFGMETNPQDAMLHIREIILRAREYNKMVRLDMENSAFVNDELSMFKRLYSEFPENVGLVLQAYLKRSMTDLENLTVFQNPKHPINIRLCKGIYMEDSSIVYKDSGQINDNFMKMLEFMFTVGIYPGIATHDQKLIDRATELIKKRNLPKTAYEFQMLYGVTENRRSTIVDAGHKMRVYVPFGEDWYNYSTRRLKENPQLINHIIKSLFIKS